MGGTCFFQELAALILASPVHAQALAVWYSDLQVQVRVQVCDFSRPVEFRLQVLGQFPAGSSRFWKDGPG
jgi:hypothetical protein